MKKAKKILSLFLTIAISAGIMTAGTVAAAAAGAADSWDGTADVSWYTTDQTAFAIDSEEELAGLAELVNGGNALAGVTLTLTTDLDLTYAASGWVPIGKTTDSADYVFEGVFDGGGHTISNLRIGTSAQEPEYLYEYSGLFGVLGAVDKSGVIKNVNLANASIYTAQSAGAVAARANLGSTIINCTSSGTVYSSGFCSEFYVGGIVGLSHSSIINCGSACSVTGGASVNGYGGSYVGGLAGYCSQSIYNCYASGAVKGCHAGGLVGSASNNKGCIVNCCATGTVSAADSNAAYVGGFAGIIAGYNTVVSNCYAAGMAYDSGGSIQAFGFVGNASSTVFSNCYYNQSMTNDGSYSGCTGTAEAYDMTAVAFTDTLSTNALALADLMPAGINPGKWTAGTGGCPKPVSAYKIDGDIYPGSVLNSVKITASADTGNVLAYKIFTALSPDILSYENAAITDAASYTSGSDIGSVNVGDYIVIYELKGSALVKYTFFQLTEDVVRNSSTWTGDGSAANPFQIGSANNLNYLSTRVNSGTTFANRYFVVMDNITLTDTWTPIGTDESQAFCGIFDGGGKTISGLKLGSESSYDNTYTYIGLFGCLNGATLRNTGVEGGKIYSSAADDFAGLLAGFSKNSLIIGCYASGIVSGTRSVGGLVGYNNSGIIINCFSRTAVYSDYAAGGLVGRLAGDGSILNSYAVGNISCLDSGDSYAGGLAGRCNGGRILNCYAACILSNGAGAYEGGFLGYIYQNDSTLENCYWNSEGCGSDIGTDPGQYGTTGLSAKVMSGQEAPADGITYTDSASGSTATTEIFNNAFIQALNGGIGALSGDLPTGVSAQNWKSDSDNVNSGYPIFGKTYVTSITVTGYGGASRVENGKTLQMGTAVLPEDATDSSVTWSVTGVSGTATISGTGVLTGISAGAVKVTAAATDGSNISGNAVIEITAPAGTDGGGSVEDNIATVTSEGVTTATIETNATAGSGGTAAASVTASRMISAINHAVEEAEEQRTEPALEIEVNTGDDATGVSLTIPQSSFGMLSGSSVTSLTVSTPVVTITFDKQAITGIQNSASGDVTISVQKADTSGLSDSAKALIGSRPVYDFTVSSGGTTISSFGGGTATVSIPYTPADGEDTTKIVVYYISDSGELVMVPDCVYDAATGRVAFKTTHFSSYAVGYNDVNFSDVSGWYKDYVDYLAARKIVSGTGGGKYSPDANITRAEFATILIRMSGDGLSGDTASAFSDVSTSDWYFAAVQWAYQNGIASGYNGNFSPNANITREEMAVMLHNYAKYAGVSVSNAEGMSIREFSDYGSISSWALEPIQWAINNSIISGNPEGSFAPKDSATRAQAAKIVAVLMRETIG